MDDSVDYSSAQKLTDEPARQSPGASLRPVGRFNSVARIAGDVTANADVVLHSFRVEEIGRDGVLVRGRTGERAHGTKVFGHATARRKLRLVDPGFCHGNRSVAGRARRASPAPDAVAASNNPFQCLLSHSSVTF